MYKDFKIDDKEFAIKISHENELSFFQKILINDEIFCDFYYIYRTDTMLENSNNMVSVRLFRKIKKIIQEYLLVNKPYMLYFRCECPRKMTIYKDILLRIKTLGYCIVEDKETLYLYKSK